jgi:hypothetical protein
MAVMTTRPESTDQKILERIRALLSKAEASSFPEEADAFTAKAQWLMSKHSIEQALLEGDAHSTSARSLCIVHDSPYASQKATLLSQISRPNSCRAVYESGTTTSTVFGFEHDLAAVELLYTSLLVQAGSEMMQAERVGGLDPSRLKSFRAAFFIGYGARVAKRLSDIRDIAAAEATQEVGEDVLPVLASREMEVSDAVREAFPRTTSRRPSLSNGTGFLAGQVAGDKADLGPRGARLTNAS